MPSSKIEEKLICQFNSVSLANNHPLGLLTFLDNFAESASVRIDVKKFYKIYQFDGWLWSSMYILKTFCLVGKFTGFGG